MLECRCAQLGTVGSGEITNLMTVDVQRIQDAASSFNQFWSLPIQVAITLYLLYREVSYAFIAGLVVIVLMIPVNMVIAKVRYNVCFFYFASYTQIVICKHTYLPEIIRLSRVLPNGK